MNIKNPILLAFLLFCSYSSLVSYPSINYDWYQPAKNVSPIGIALGGVNQVYAEDFGIAYENPAFLALRKGMYFSTTFKSSRMNNQSFSQVLNPKNLLGDKQFTYFSVSMPNFAFSYQPIINTSSRFENGFYSEYHDLYLNSYVLSLAGLDEDFPELSLGFNLKFIDGRQVYVKHRKELGLQALEELVDGDVVGYSSDLGLTYSRNTIMVGLTLKDLISRLYWNDRKDNHLRKRYSLGLGFYNENSIFQIATQGRLNTGREQTYHLGYGYSLNIDSALSQALAIKAGIFSDEFNEMDNINYTLGLGYSISMFRIDVSLISAGFTMDNTDFLFSVTIGQ